MAAGSRFWNGTRADEVAEELGRAKIEVLKIPGDLIDPDPIKKAVAAV